MEGTTYGYVRVSTHEQNEARQLAAMRKFGVEERNIVTEKLSGKDFNRPLYQRLVKQLRSGDVLVIKSIDRLGRNYTEILEQWAAITKKREAAIVVLDMPRQAEGIAAAKARGVRFGPKARALPDSFDDLRQAWRGGRITLREAASACGMPKSTFYDAALRTETSKNCF